MNTMFWTPRESMPLAFRQAVADTSCLLESLSGDAAKGGALFLLAASDDCTAATPGMRLEFEARTQKVKRAFEEAGYLKKIQEIASARGIPLVDLAPALRDISDKAHPHNDIHMTDAANSAAAGAMAKVLLERGFGR